MSAIQISGNGGKFTIDVKRFRIPGVSITTDCPRCGHVGTYDLDVNYLSYPTANAPSDFNFYCPECEEEWSVKIVLRISVEAAE